MAEYPPAVRIAHLRVRVTARAVPREDAALRDAVRRQLPADLDPTLAGALVVELSDQVRRAAARAAGGGSR